MSKKVINSFDRTIDKNKIKLNTLINHYTTANASQVFAQPKSKTLKTAMAEANGNVGVLEEIVTNDLLQVMKVYFDDVDINISHMEVGNNYALKMDLVCDGVPYNGSTILDGTKAIHNNPYLRLYEDYEEGE